MCLITVSPTSPPLPDGFIPNPHIQTSLDMGAFIASLASPGFSLNPGAPPSSGLALHLQFLHPGSSTLNWNSQLASRWANQAPGREWGHFCRAKGAVDTDSALSKGGRWTQGTLPTGFGEILWEGAAAGMKSLSVNRPRCSFSSLISVEDTHVKSFDKVLSFVLFFPPFLPSGEEERKETTELKLGE